MNKLIAALLLSTCAVASALSVSAAEPIYTTYQLDFRSVAANEARGVIDRTIWSGSVNPNREAEILSLVKGNAAWTEKAWFDDHPDVTVLWAVPFYGAAKTPVAFEYYLQCGDVLCGSVYDVFPGVDTIEEAVAAFYPRGKALKAFDRGHSSNPIMGSLATFFVPDAVPVSIRLAESIPDGRMQFFHGIYAIRASDLKVTSLDPRDASLTRSQLKTRLRGLIDSSMTSSTNPLIYERARSRGYLQPFVPNEGRPSAVDMTFDELRLSERPYECLNVPAPQPRTIFVSNGDGTFHEETTIHQFPGNQYETNCLGYLASIPLFNWNYTLIGQSDYLTGRVASGLYQVSSYLSNPL